MRGSFGSAATGFHWNFYDRLEEGQLTNNPSEGANNRLATRMGASHPGFYHFCTILTKELNNSKNNLEDFENGGSKESTNKKTTLQYNRSVLKLRLEERKITLRKYMRAQGALNHQPGGRGGSGHRGGGAGGGDPEPGAGDGEFRLRAALRSVTEEDPETSDQQGRMEALPPGWKF